MFQELIKQGPFNLFVGAGISKLPPSNGPLWREMLRDFVDSLFSTMEREGWSVSNTYVQDKSLLWDFNFRPESFWQIVQQQTSIELVCKVFQVLNCGVSNLNHRLIAYLLSKGIIANVVTTNFDEYIDAKIFPATRRIVTSSEMKQIVDESKSQPLTNCYFKIHGSISMADSLQFTLAHTTMLPTEKAQCLEACISGRPLLVAGYSGNDDDIMPRLREIVERLPAVTFMVHPGTRQDEPIRELARSSATVALKEADINAEFRQWIEREVATGNVPKSILHDRSAKVPVATSLYELAVDTLPMALIPLVISSLFEFTGNIDGALRYANLADDVCEDSRYLDEVSKNLRGRVLRQLSLYYGAAGDARLSAILASKALDADSAEGSVTKIVELHLTCAFGLLFKDRLSEYEEKQAEFWLNGAYAMVKLGIIHGMVAFPSCWYLGRLRRKQGRLAEAVALYKEAEEISLKLMEKQEAIDHVTIASFALDYGDALLYYGIEEGRVETTEDAGRLFSLALAIARKASDHLTETKALMNLAQGNYLGGAVEVAQKQIVDAERCAALTGDAGLQARVAQLKKALYRG